MKIHHIGYLVKNIDKAKINFEKLGFKETTKTSLDENRKTNIAFMENNGYTIELVSPATEDSVVSGLIKKYRNSPYHLCYIADNFEKDISELTAGGFTQIDAPMAATAINNKKVVFLMNASIGLIELLEN